MQKAKAEAEEVARRKSDTSEQPAESQSVKEKPERSPTPKQQPLKAESSAKAEENKKHQKTKSESAREATFASLQRALNAAVAARDRFTRRDSRAKHESPLEEESVSPTSMAPPQAAPSVPENKVQSSVDHSYQNWSDAKEPAHAHWASPQDHSAAGQYPTTSQALTDLPSSSHSVHQNVDAYAGAQFSQNEDWVDTPKDQHAMQGMGSDAGLGYTNMQYPLSMQAPDISVTRRESSSALTASFEGIGICTPGSSGMPQSSSQAASWKEPGKELDLAARRKRPRPAAIGTSNTRSLAASTSMSSLSPTSRMPNSATGNSMKHSKSAQGLSSRYAGVRKASAAQRSPLNFTFAESGSMKSSKAEMLRPSVSSTSLAPPTPLTPQDFQHFMPASPTDSYCLSAHSTTQFFPSSQPMQVNIASPPTTPLDIYSPFTFQNGAPPMSAPAQVSTFPEYVTCDPVPMTARSWADNTALSSPDFPAGLQVPHSNTVSPIGFDGSVEQHGHNFMEPVSGSPSLIYSIEDADMPVSTEGERKASEFTMHEFHEQQEAQRFAAQQMGSLHKPKSYAFANNATPSHYP